MAYLQPADYPKFGLPPGTSEDWVTMATALINSYCRRPDLNVTQYTERMRITGRGQSVRLSYLPLCPLEQGASPIINIEGKYSGSDPRDCVVDSLYQEACVFNLPGQWSAIDPNSIDLDLNTGEVTLPRSIFGLGYSEIKVTYMAGLTIISDDIKAACAQIVRNAQATPALNASRTRIDTMQIEYFSSSLLDDTVKSWLRPYVANRLG